VIGGSAIGGGLRYLLSGTVALQFGEIFSVGHVAVGFICDWTLCHSDRPDGRVMAGATARQFVMTGICRGDTTFSSFRPQTLNLARDEESLYAGANIVGSVVLCLAAVWIGHIAAAAINQLKGT
jgi:fluoride exporter